MGLDLNEESVTFWTSSGTITLEWERCTKRREDDRWLILYTTTEAGHPIPKSAIPEAGGQFIGRRLALHDVGIDNLPSNFWKPVTVEGGGLPLLLSLLVIFYLRVIFTA